MRVINLRARSKWEIILPKMLYYVKTTCCMTYRTLETCQCNQSYARYHVNNYDLTGVALPICVFYLNLHPSEYYGLQS